MDACLPAGAAKPAWPGRWRSTPSEVILRQAQDERKNEVTNVGASYLDLGQPGRVFGIAPIDDVKEGSLNFLGDGSA